MNTLFIVLVRGQNIWRESPKGENVDEKKQRLTKVYCSHMGLHFGRYPIRSPDSPNLATFNERLMYIALWMKSDNMYPGNRWTRCKSCEMKYWLCKLIKRKNRANDPSKYKLASPPSDCNQSFSFYYKRLTSNYALR